MRRGSTGILGGGIYFAESVEDASRKCQSSGYLVTARILVGDAHYVSKGDIHRRNSSNATANALKTAAVITLAGTAVIAAPVLGVGLGALAAGTEAATGALAFSGLMAVGGSALSGVWYIGGLAWEAGDLHENFYRLNAAGFDSIYLSGLQTDPEIIVFNRDQVELVSVIPWP
eukprot:Skav236528  [mRNA]  locus=scaffold78:1072327:1072845:- [translate_table: standard]